MGKFETLLTEYIRDHERSVSAFARRMEISHTAVNNVLNGESRATAEFVIKAAQAMSRDPVAMLCLAGYLPSLPPAQEDEARLINLWRQIKPQQRETILQALSGLVGSEPTGTIQRGQSQEEGREATAPRLGGIIHDFMSLDDPLRQLLEDYISAKRDPQESDRRLKILLTLARDALQEYQDSLNGDSPASQAPDANRELPRDRSLSEALTKRHDL